MTKLVTKKETKKVADKKPAAKKPTTKKRVTKKPAAKKEVAVTKEPVPKYTALRDTVLKTIADDEAAIRELKDQLSKLEHKLEDEKRERSYYQKIENMANWETKPYTWNMRRTDYTGSYNDKVWSEYYTYSAACLEFHISLAERKDLKKFKWEVNVSCTKLRLETGRYGYSGGHIGTDYQDYDYGRSKYMLYQYNKEKEKREYLPDPEKGNLVLCNKFSNEAEARKWLKEWQERLIKDHKETIDYELSLLKQCKKLPKDK